MKTINKKIFVTGHKGFLGREVVKKLKQLGYKKIITKDRKDLDLTNFDSVKKFIKNSKPSFIINCAGLTGGFLFNLKNPFKIFINNLLIQNNIIFCAQKYNVKRVIMIASNSNYPEKIRRPLIENDLMSGPVSKSHEAFSFAKIAGITFASLFNQKLKFKLFTTIVLPNIYGPGDKINHEKSSFFISLIKKIYDAKIKKKKTIQLFGNGKEIREIIYVEDVAEAIIFFLNLNTKYEVVNIGSKIKNNINWYAKFIMKKLKVNFKIKYLLSKNNTLQKKVMDTSIAKSLGWHSKYNDLNKNFEKTYKNFVKRYSITN